MPNRERNPLRESWQQCNRKGKKLGCSKLWEGPNQRASSLKEALLSDPRQTNKNAEICGTVALHEYSAQPLN